MLTKPFCGCGNQQESITQPIYINSCYRETILDGITPLLFFIVSCTYLTIKYHHSHDYTFGLPTVKALSMFRTSLCLLIVTLLEISNWAFLFAWRLESVILEGRPCKGPPLYQIINPGLAFISRFYVLVLIIKSFTATKFTRYNTHLLCFYSIILLSAIVRVFDYIFTDNKWFISSSIEIYSALIDFGLCFILWMTIMTAPSELDQRELIDFEDNDDNVLVMQDGNVIRNGRILSAEPTASPLSSITFSWMNPLLKAAFHSRLTVTSLWELPARQRARENYRLFAEQQRASTVITVSSLLQRIFKANRAIIIHQFVTAIGAVIFHYANPYFLRQLLNYIQVHQKEDRVDREIGYLYCLALFICSVISTLIASQSLLWGRRWHVNIVHMLNSEIYAHALRLKQAHDMSEDEEEEKSNLINQDTERVAELASYLHIFYTCPLEIIAGVVFLYQILGTAFLAGLIVMVIALPSTHYINQKLMKAQTHLNDAKSWRIRLLKELCEGMKTIKTLASERRWEDAISSARDEELVKLIKVYTQNTLLNLIWFAMPVFVTTTSFAWYTLVEKKSLDASTAFVSIVLFGMLRDPLNVVPQAFIAYNDIYVSLGHVVRFLNTEEKRDDAEIIATCDSDNDDGDHPFDYEEQSKITLRTAVFKWSSGNDAFRLKVPFELEIPSSRLSVLSGPSACGKTSLLKALLGDMPLDSGERPLLPSRFLCTANTHKSLVRDPVCPLFYLHKVAYVSQIAWIEHTTVRENILFSESWDDARYRTVLHQCDLLRDLSLFENGDLTVVGDKSTIFNNGVNIEALYHKISLARAVYSRAKTVLIDDIFQVLGKTVSTFIYENCIRGDLMRERTVIVAAAYPDMFWARDAAIFIHISLVSNGQGVVDSVETDPEKIVGMIKQRRADRLTLVDAVRHYDIFGDVVDVLFENNSVMAGVFTEDEFFDEASIMPASIRLLDEEENAKRDYAYATYLSACGGWQYWSFAVLFTLLACISNIAESYWLKEGLVHDLSNTLIAVLFNFVRTIIQYRGSLRASNRLFLGLLRSVCHAPIQFFEITPPGRILERFIKDIEIVDGSIGWQVGFLLQMAFSIIGAVFTIGIILPEFFVVSTVATIIYLYIGIIYIKASKELKRLNVSSRPPILHLFSDTLTGLLTIRAYGEEWTMMKKMFNRLDDNMRPFYTLWTTNRWLFVRVELLGTLLSLFISILLVYKMDIIDAGMAGIALTFSTNLQEYVYWLMRQSTAVDIHFESVEKINEYMNAPQEPPSIVEGSRPPASWPTAATIQIKDLMVSFNHSEVDAALKHVTLNIYSGEKVALIGRADGEKNALVSSLFRFVEPMAGSIKIDGVNIAWIGVEDLRSRITYITKESWLLSGTVRSNLDPFGEYEDYALWQVLYKVYLAKPHDQSQRSSHSGSSGSGLKGLPFSYIHDLDYDIGKNGSRFTVCQRQLLCIARALLQDCTRLVVFEEADLSIESQEIIRSVIDQEFQESTLLVIPYLLRQVVYYDKVIVFDHGTIAEMDSPGELLNRQGSLLQLLCDKAGILDELTLDIFS